MSAISAIEMPSIRYAPVKRAIDILVALVGLILISPTLLLIALAIRIESPGPVVYAAERTGLHGRRFRMLKFRTMVRNAEELKAELRHLSIVPWPDFKLIDDPRITRLGKFLRKTSLDELPQLWNVLVGDMSLVGPRPTSFAVDTYDLWHTARLEVRPGITGYWQVKGRNSATFDERLRMDLAYIRDMSFFTDVKVVTSTFASVMKRDGA
ncbi:MAG: hypothetical protein QOH79_3283 [Acidimicrobiaceae bacterium]|jgi:lipopolysaccharide/colanic/teichoic acid biosynthesis glycosyltransferase